MTEHGAGSNPEVALFHSPPQVGSCLALAGAAGAFVLPPPAGPCLTRSSQRATRATRRGDVSMNVIPAKKKVCVRACAHTCAPALPPA
jgi:hypothetical protein